ncbi:MAG: rhomboid family intramembrane serine protease [Lachnospiraceae bacterium]|nr:rhomboid family intramembrane serine protease [Lachnospiraceae bacterium]
MKKRIDYFITEMGYYKLQSNRAEIIIYYKNQVQFVSVLLLLDMQSGLVLPPNIYVQMRQQIIEQFLEKGYDEVHMLSLLLTEHAGQDGRIVEKDRFSWIVDLERERLLIPDDHAEDFYGLKKVIENALAAENIPSYQDEAEEEIEEPKKPPYAKRAAVNFVILLANFIIFTICIFTGDRLYEAGMMYPDQVLSGGKWYQLLTSMFLHADVSHIFGNMILLFLLGDIVERECGHVKYTFLYVLSGIAGGVLSLSYSMFRGDYTPSLGASGAIYGVVGTFLWILVRNWGRVEDIVLPRAAFMIGYSMYLGFVSSHVDNAAHVGGLIAGIILGILFYSKRERTGANEG